MALLENHTASFIVRIWCESSESGSACGEWRGSIEHVPSGQRGFFRDLGAVGRFIKPHLEQLGIDTRSRFWQLADDEPEPNPAPPK
jgi:hypothetical protein